MNGNEFIRYSLLARFCFDGNNIFVEDKTKMIDKIMT